METYYDNAGWERLMDKRVERFNAARFDTADGFAPCAVCWGKRVVAHRHGEGLNASWAMAPCACMDIIRRGDAAKRSGMEQLLMRCGFENFQVREPWQQSLLEAVRACADTDSWLLLCGQSGCGKTHLAAALCRELIARDRKVRYMSWPGEARGICAAAFDYDRRQSLLAPFKDAEVLLLDDLFKTRLDAAGVPEVSRQELDLAFELIDHRVVQDKRTLITCEVSTGKLRQLSEALTGRILEKAGTFVKNITPAPGRNWRAKTA